MAMMSTVSVKKESKACKQESKRSTMQQIRILRNPRFAADGTGRNGMQEMGERRENIPLLECEMTRSQDHQSTAMNNKSAGMGARAGASTKEADQDKKETRKEEKSKTMRM